jgi:hypothetical protein
LIIPATAGVIILSPAFGILDNVNAAIASAQSTGTANVATSSSTYGSSHNHPWVGQQLSGVLVRVPTARRSS